ncbi:MAG: hypothetical protein QGF67_12355 [Lentisphaeria bacterium]|nr:hypothetical protein [Lentisphaeria bacterium]
MQHAAAQVKVAVLRCHALPEAAGHGGQDGAVSGFVDTLDDVGCRMVAHRVQRRHPPAPARGSGVDVGVADVKDVCDAAPAQIVHVVHGARQRGPPGQAECAGGGDVIAVAEGFRAVAQQDLAAAALPPAIVHHVRELELDLRWLLQPLQRIGDGQPDLGHDAANLAGDLVGVEMFVISLPGSPGMRDGEQCGRQHGPGVFPGVARQHQEPDAGHGGADSCRNGHRRIIESRQADRDRGGHEKPEHRQAGQGEQQVVGQGQAIAKLLDNGREGHRRRDGKHWAEQLPPIYTNYRELG